MLLPRVRYLISLWLLALSLLSIPVLGHAQSPCPGFEDTEKRVKGGGFLELLKSIGAKIGAEGEVETRSKQIRELMPDDRSKRGAWALFIIECRSIFADRSFTPQQQREAVRKAFELFTHGVPKERPATLVKSSFTQISPEETAAPRTSSVPRELPPTNERTGQSTTAPVRNVGTSASDNAPIVRLFPKANLPAQAAWELSKRLPRYRVALGNSDLVGKDLDADMLFISKENVSPRQIMDVVDALDGMGIGIRMIQNTNRFRPREIQIGTIDGDFGDLDSLDVDELRRLSRGSNREAFFSYVRNGWNCRQLAIGKAQCEQE